MSAPIQVGLVGFWWVVKDGQPDKPPCAIPLKFPPNVLQCEPEVQLLCDIPDAESRC